MVSLHKSILFIKAQRHIESWSKLLEARRGKLFNQQTKQFGPRRSPSSKGRLPFAALKSPPFGNHQAPS